MSKRKKSGRRPRTGSAGYRTAVVDMLEIGSTHGNLTLRAGRDDGQSVCVVLPAEVLPSFMDGLRHARLDAEEDYWSVVHQVVSAARSSGQTDIPRALQKWLLAQNWSKVLGAVPSDTADPLVLVTHAGHIGFRLAPPYTNGRALAIFDPLQFHRLEPALLHHSSEAQRQAAVALVHPRDAAALALHRISSQPWPPGSPAQPPPVEEAGKYMQKRYEAFQRRSPYVRAEENTLDLGSGMA